MTEYNNTINQEYTKNQLVKGPKKKNNALGAVLRAFNPQRYKISVFTIKLKFTPIERTRKAYIKAVSIQAERQKRLIQTIKTPPTKTRAEKSYQFYGFKYLVYGIKNLWCVCPKSNFSKIQKSSTGVIFKGNFFKKFSKKYFPGVCPKIH
jgi:hypothetical protein